MANGEQTPPTQTGPSLNASTRGGVSGLGEGWGTGSAAFDEVFANVKVVYGAVRGELLKAWFAVVAILFALETLEVVAYAVFEVNGIFGDVLGLVFTPFRWLIGLLFVAGTALQLSLYGPLRERIFHDIEPEGWLDALRSGGERFWSVFGATLALSLIIPLCCVVPGLVLAFFGVMAPYFAATEEIGVVDSFKKSYERAKGYWQIFAVTIGALLATGAVFGCVMGAGTAVASFAPEPMDYVLRGYAGWIGTVLLQFGVFIVWGGVFVTVDSNETGQSIQ